MRWDAFELRIAWRHLRARERRAWLIPFGALGLYLAAVGVFLIAHAAGLDAPEFGGEYTPLAADVARLLGLVTFGVGVFAAVFAALTALFNLLSAIIVLSVAQGCMALVIVLSLMTGLELDLRGKILGQRAEIRISREDGEAFGDSAALLAALGRRAEIAAAGPYVEGEVMLRSDFNRQGALLVGVDPDLHRRVTSLAEMVRAGDYDLLVAPERGPWDAMDRVIAERERRAAAFARRADEDVAPGGEDLRLAPEEPVDDPEDADDVDGDGWEDPSVEIPRLREAGAIPPAGEPIPDLSGEFVDDHLQPAPVVHESEVDGPPVSGGAEVPLMIGRELAEQLGVDFGERLQVITPVGRMTPNGPVPSAMTTRVVALFHSGMSAYDHGNLYVPIDRAQAFLRLGPRVHGVDVRLVDGDRLDEGVAAARAAVAESGLAGVQVESWRVLHRNVFTAMLLEKIAMFIGLLFVVLVAAFGILATNLMSVLDKAQQIAILKAMGATDRAIARVFMIEGLVVGFLGAAVGIAAGLVVCALLAGQGLPISADNFYLQRLPVVVDPREVALVGLAALVIVWVSSVHPARTAAQMRPVDGLRQGE